MNKFTDIEKRTKAIYVEQHKAYIKDRSIFDRFYKVAINHSSYDVPDGFFKGKRIADIGCGNTAYFQKAMFDLGASHITCVDIGEDWMSALGPVLESLGVPSSFYRFVSASAMSLPLEDGDFDFVASNGVLMHLDGVTQAERAMREMSRVTRRGGTLYAYVGMSEPGIMDRYIVPSLRKAYQEDAEFKQFIDDLKPADFQKLLMRYADIAQKNDTSTNVPQLRSLFKLFTLDTITFWQNALQVPVQQGTALGEEWAVNEFRKNGFVNVRRTPTLFWKRNDVRKYFALVHYDTSNPLTRLFYGNGHLKMVGDKAQ